MIDTLALRNKILDLAVRGQLTEQLSEDGTAEDLYQQIQREKQKLVKAGKIRKEKALPENTEEIPFEIPEGWKWVRFSAVVDVRDGTHDTPAYVLKGIPLVTSKNLVDGIIDFESTRNISIEDATAIDVRSRVDDGDILFAMIGTIGNPILVKKDRDFCIKNVALFKPIAPYLLDMQFVLFFLIKAQSDMKKISRGTTQSFVSLTILRNYMFPLPPLAEQKRIVEKVNQAFTILDTIDELQAQYADNLTALKSKLLDAAIQGRLVPQDASEGTGEELYWQIQWEKQALIKAGKIRKEKTLPKITWEEIPFDIPEGWVWVRLEQITYPVGNKNNQILASSVLKNGRFPVISQGKDFIDGFCDDVDKVIYDIPLILFGDHTRIVKYVDFPFVIGADGTKLIKGIVVDARFLYYLVVYSAFSMWNRGYARHYSLLKQQLLPLPPLAEQKRIVAKLEELLPLCDRLKQLNSARS